MAGKLPQLGPDSSPRLTLSRAGSPTALPPARSPDPSLKKWAPQRAHAEPDKTAPCPPRREPGYLPLADMPEVVSPHFLRPFLYQWFRPVSSLAPGSGSPGSAAKLLQSCPTLCDSIDGSPPGSAAPGILQPLRPLRGLQETRVATREVIYKLAMAPAGPLFIPPTQHVVSKINLSMLALTATLEDTRVVGESLIRKGKCLCIQN